MDWEEELLLDWAIAQLMVMESGRIGPWSKRKREVYDSLEVLLLVEVFFCYLYL